MKTILALNGNARRAAEDLLAAQQAFNKARLQIEIEYRRAVEALSNTTCPEVDRLFGILHRETRTAREDGWAIEYPTSGPVLTKGSDQEEDERLATLAELPTQGASVH